MKLGQLYDLKKISAIQNAAPQRPAGNFLDADPGLLIASSLRYIDPKIFEKKYPELAFVNSGIEVDNSGGYAEFIMSRRKDIAGGFRNALDDSNNKGKISLKSDNSQIRVIERSAFSEWSDTQIKQAQIEGINLPSDHIVAHNQVYLKEVDEFGYIGNTEAKTQGLLNYSDFATSTETTAPEAMTGEQLYNMFAELITAQWTSVNNIPEYRANRVDMPISVANMLRSKYYILDNVRVNVLKALQNDFPEVTFSATFRAENIAGNRVIAAYTNNSQAIIFRIPVPLTISDIDVRKFMYSFDSKYRMAGLDVLVNEAGNLLHIPLQP
jgi:hypothetical protein